LVYPWPVADDSLHVQECSHRADAEALVAELSEQLKRSQAEYTRLLNDRNDASHRLEKAHRDNADALAAAGEKEEALVTDMEGMRKAIEDLGAMNEKNVEQIRFESLPNARAFLVLRLHKSIELSAATPNPKPCSELEKIIVAQDDEMQARREILERMVVQTKEAADKEGAIPIQKKSRIPKAIYFYQRWM
jgi:hypothetical protein